MSRTPTRGVLKLCESYASMTPEAQTAAGKLLDCGFDPIDLTAYERLSPTAQHDVTLFIEIAASENVGFAEFVMRELHDFNATHPCEDRRAWWELEASR